MISAGFALLQPEAFAAKVGRAEPLRTDAGSREPFSVSLQRESNREGLWASSETIDAKVAPKAAQDSTSEAQTSILKDAERSDVASESHTNSAAEGDAKTSDAESGADERVDSRSQHPVIGETTARPGEDASKSSPGERASDGQRPGGAVGNTASGSAHHSGQLDPGGDAESPATETKTPQAVAPSAAHLDAISSTVAESTEVARSTPAPAPSPERRTAAAETRPEFVEATATPDESAEVVKTARVNAVDGPTSSPDLSAGAGEPRAFVEALGRSVTSGSQATPTAESSGENRLFEAQVTRGLEAALRQNGGSVTIRLKPESLGALKIDLQIAQGVVAARLEAASPEARELLNQHMAALRTALEAKGFSVRSIEVQVPSTPNGAETNAEFNRSFSGQSQSQSQDAQAGANGHTSGRREDPGGASWNNQHHDPLAEDERIEPGWRSVYVNGSLNAVA